MQRVFAKQTEHQRINAAAWLLVLAGLMVSMQVSAATAGRLLFARGVVEVLHEGAEPHRVIRGDTVDVGDTVRTGVKASAQIRLTDGAMIALRSDSLFKIEQQVYNKAKPEENSQAAQLLRGGLRAITGAIGHERPSAVKLSTPVATIGIRGTVYDTIYVPPEGLPGLPDVPPGHYTLVLKGRVSLSNPVGELLLGVGEIGYVADANSPPVLRPDLSWMFAQYATLKEDDGGGDDTNVGAPTITPVDNVLTETATAQPGAKPGPFALVAATNTDVTNAYMGAFFNQSVTTGSSGELLLATGGTGSITSFNSNGSTVLTSPVPQGSVTAGNSTIYWGMYFATDVTLGPTDLTGSNVSYMTATNVLTSLNDLPTTGSYSYTMVANTTGILSGSLIVDFGTARMDISLDDSANNNGTWSASNQAIAGLYGSGISLSSSSSGTGTMVGRFVGSHAEGAMTSYILNGNTLEAGTAAFTR